jgi:23S rRNA (uracil1939-C5)-methyltransferase
MQHMHPAAQTAAKQRVLEDALWHVGRLRPEVVFPAIAGAAWGYRSRARMSVRLVAKKGGVLVGFHEKRSSFVAVMDGCEVLPPAMSALITPLKKLMIEMSAPDRLPQIEVAIGGEQIVLLLRHLDALSEDDKQRLRMFSDEHRIVWYLQSKGPETVHLFHPTDAPSLMYRLDEFNVELHFSPTEFTQVNQGVNAMLVRRAMRLLDAQPDERIADLFCGLGNFTLPIARSGARVVGIEGSAQLVARARENAQRNGLADRCEFGVANLFEVTPESYSELSQKSGPFDKLLIDPPRDGAFELVKALPESGAPWRIVYVSCSPSTLARDAAVLVTQKGYALKGAGIASMFPQTSHVESIAVFEREK